MRDDRIALRATHQERERLLKAARFSGMTLSSFLRQAALEKSEDILRSNEVITLSDRDRDLFLDALENPQKSNRNLLQAFRKYQKLKSYLNREFQEFEPVKDAIRAIKNLRKGITLGSKLSIREMREQGRR